MTGDPTLWRNPVRWLKVHPLAADTLLAVVIAAVSIPSLFVDHPEGDYRDANGVAVLLVLAQTLPLALRRRRPYVVLTIIAVLTIVSEWSTFPPSTGGVPALIALYTVAVHRPRRQSLRAAGLMLIGIIVAVAGSAAEPGVGDVVQTVLIFAAAWAFGNSQQVRLAHLAELEERTALLERDREARAERAVAEERARIARELHDVVAHNVSVMVVQAGAARRTVARDQDAAVEAMTLIETTGRQALDEMRRLLGVLRRSGEPDRAALSPQPSVGELDLLAAQMGDAGLPVELEVIGEPQPLASGIDLSAYRIVQEALTNTLKHAGADLAVVRVEYGLDDVEITVTDNGRGPGPRDAATDPGHGLVGMRERVALFGGELEIGPRRGGGFRVRARLPLSPARSL